MTDARESALSGAPTPSRICEQIGHDKVMDASVTLTTNPPQTRWICRRCLVEGTDMGTTIHPATEYDTLRAIKNARP